MFVTQSSESPLRYLLKTCMLVQCCYNGCAVKYKIYPVFFLIYILYFTFYSTIYVTTLQKAYSFRASNAMVCLKTV
jgi:hypothetical protein